MQMIFVVTKEFVKDLKYERYEYVADIYACWLKRPEKDNKHKNIIIVSEYFEYAVKEH